MKFTEISNTKLTEAFDNPYPFELIGPNDAQEYSALAKTPNGMLRMDFETTDYDNFGIDFSVGKSMGKTEAGDEFRVFATVVAMMKKWIKTVGIEHVESFDFGANKGEHASDGRAKLYTRFAKQLASKLGWRLEQSTTSDRSTAFFKLTNPKPVPREQEYWDKMEETVNENVSALQAELEQKYNLKSLFLADMGKRNAIELHSIIVNKEEQGEGTGSKVMQEIIAYADDNGKIVVLDPGLLDKQHGTTSQSRLRKFYKRFGFIDNKGRNKNYEFRNLMIRYPQTKESVNEVSKEEFDAIQNGYVDIEFDKKWWPLNDDYPLIKHIGKAIGATSWTSWGKVGVPWSETEMIGGGGTYMLKGDFGHILLDAAKSFRPEQILMAQISTSKRGGGIGSKVMNAIKSYADQKGLPITIYKVTNKKFFDKFEWLTKTGEDTYEYKLNESINEGYKLQLERDTDMMVLNITDTKTGKRTEVRGKSGYETNNYDANDKLHQLLDKISKSADISQLMNGEPVGINPKHPDGPSAKTATTKAFNEAAGVGRVVKGVNTTVDVGVDEIINQVKKFGNDVNRDGIPTKNLRTK
jgi:GNAT superfamily N-acetyltransferase